MLLYKTTAVAVAMLLSIITTVISVEDGGSMDGSLVEVDPYHKIYTPMKEYRDVFRRGYVPDFFEGKGNKTDEDIRFLELSNLCAESLLNYFTDAKNWVNSPPTQPVLASISLIIANLNDVSDTDQTVQLMSFFQIRLALFTISSYLIFTTKVFN